MQPSPSSKGTTPSTKAALDHLQLLIEQLLDENHNLKHSLRETRSQLDQVRAHLKSFKHDLAEREKNECLVRTHIRTMAALIERSRQPNLPNTHVASTALPPSLNPSSQTPPLLSVTSQSLPSQSLPPSSTSSTRAQSTRASSPRASSPRASSPSAPSPRAPSPRAPSPRAPSPRAPSPRAHSPSPQSPSAPSPSTPSPRAQSPGAQPPDAQSPGAQSPSAQSPGAKSLRAPLSTESSARPPSPRTPSRMQSPILPSPRAPPPSSPSPGPPIPRPPSPSAPLSGAHSLTAALPSESSPRPPSRTKSSTSSSPRAPSTSSPSSAPSSPTPASPRLPSLSAPSPAPRSPSTPAPAPAPPSPSAPWPRTPSPSVPLPRPPSPSPSLLRAPSPISPSLRAQSPRTPSPNTLSPGSISKPTHVPIQNSPTTESADLSHSPLPVASITKIKDIYGSPKIHGNVPQARSTTGLDSPLYVGPTPEPSKHVTRSRCISQSPVDVSTSRSPDTKSLTDKRTAPSTSISDALQKAFVDMEKDTTNAVHVLHDPSHIVSLRSAQAGVDSVSLPPAPTDTNLPSKPSESRGANGAHRDKLDSVKKQSQRHVRKRSLKPRRKTVDPSSPASDSALSQPSKQLSFTGANGRLKRSLTQPGKEHPKSPQRTANKLAKTLALKRTKKGYKVSLGLSRNSKKSGEGSSDSSGSSSDSDSGSDSSGGPGCSVSLSRPHNRPSKAQVSMEGGLSDLMNAARKLKDTLAQRKDKDKNSQKSSSSGSDSEESEPGNESNDAGEENTDSFGIGNGSILSAAAAAAGAGTLCAVASADLTPEPFPGASGIPGLPGIVGGNNNHLQGTQPVTQNQTTGWSTWQLSERSYPRTYGIAESLPNRSFTSGFPRNPVVEPERRPSPEDLVKMGKVRTSQNGSESHSIRAFPMSSSQGEGFTEQSPAAGKATESEIAESGEDAEYPIIHEITHVSAMPQTTSDEENVDRTSTNRAKTSKHCKGNSTEFLTVHSCGSQLLRWKACPGSRYVDVSRGALAVKHPAAIAFEDGRIVVHGKMRILEPLRVEPSEANHYFASPIYPDGSFLPYVPVSGVGLHAKPMHWDNSRYAQKSVQVSFPKEIFDALALHVRRAYRKRNSSAHLRFPGAFLAGNRVRKVVKIEPDCSVNMSKLRRSPTKCSVAEAVAYTKKDIIGLALLYVSIDEPAPDRLSAEVRFGLHSMVAHHVSADRKR